MLTIQFLNGLSFAAILFLITAGLCLMLSLMDIVNLAHGSLYMLAGYLGYTVSQLMHNFIVSLLAAMAAAALISFIMERVFLRRLYKQQLRHILLTFGFIYIFQDLARTAWHGRWHFVSAPELLGGSVQILGGTFPLFRLFIILIGVIVAVGLWLLLEKTKIGALIRAGVDDTPTLESLGVNIRNIFTLVFALAGALVGWSGVLGSVTIGTYIGADIDMMILGVIVIVVGGMGKLQGAMLGSLLVGFADVFGKAYLPELAYFIVYGVLALVLAFKPSGLLGKAV